MERTFSMSMFASAEDLYKAKAEHFQELHSELIMAVERKWPDETRHETALKYIKQAEAPSTCAAQQEN